MISKIGRREESLILGIAVPKKRRTSVQIEGKKICFFWYNTQRTMDPMDNSHDEQSMNGGESGMYSMDPSSYESSAPVHMDHNHASGVAMHTVRPSASKSSSKKKSSKTISAGAGGISLPTAVKK
jgi:hypothetical protein